MFLHCHLDYPFVVNVGFPNIFKKYIKTWHCQSIVECILQFAKLLKKFLNRNTQCKEKCASKKMPEHGYPTGFNSKLKIYLDNDS